MCPKGREAKSPLAVNKNNSFYYHIQFTVCVVSYNYIDVQQLKYFKEIPKEFSKALRVY